jgi:DNA (cytosine-5)-methyltransferase 1
MAIQAAIGGELAWVSEYEPPTEKEPNPPQSAAKVLAYRHPDVPNLGDMTAVDWSSVEPVAVLGGGTPCQDVSHAGRRAGMRSGTRSGLWASMLDGIDVLRPRLVVWENVRGVYSAGADSGVEPCPLCVGDGAGTALRALGRVLGDLADIRYDARWCGFPASSVGAPHERFRAFVVAVPADLGFERSGKAWGWGYGSADGGFPATDADVDGRAQLGRVEHVERDPDGRGGADTAWGPYEPAVRRWERVLGRPAPAPRQLNRRGDGEQLSPRFTEWMMGLPAGWVTDVPGLTRNEQLHVLGNGVVPQQGAAAIRYLLEGTR